ncbi:hypothetical protein Tco_0309276 [Tanacetum coccineum]
MYNLSVISTDGRNIDVHKPFAFGAFGICGLDELREIISKKKYTIVQDLMNSLDRRYERIRKILEELRIKSALPVPVPAPEQASSKSSRKKRKHILTASMVKTPENARFSLKLKKLIVEHPDQEKLKSKKVKLEALGYEIN